MAFAHSESGTSNFSKHLLICEQYKAWLDDQGDKQPLIYEKEV